MSKVLDIPVRVKRGLKANLPPDGMIGEPMLTTDTRELFVGMGPGIPLKRLGIEFEYVDIDVAYTYNSAGDVSKEVVYDTGGVVLRETSYTYNSAGDVYQEVMKIDNQTITKTYTYDSDGNIVSYTQRIT